MSIKKIKKEIKKPHKAVYDRVRKALGVFSQQEIAEFLGTNQSSIGNYSSRGWPLKHLSKIANHTGKSLEWLETGSDEDIDNKEKSKDERKFRWQIERVKKSLDIKTSSKLAEMLEVSTQAVSQWLDRGIPRKKLEVVCEITKMPLSFYEYQEIPLFVEKVGQSKLIKNIAKQIPVYGPVAAGLPSEVLEIPQKYIEFNSIFKSHWKAMHIQGESMFPEMRHGDLIFVDWTIDKSSFKDGDPYVIYIPDEGFTVKYIYFHPDKLILQPENKRFPTLEVGKDYLFDDRIKVGAIMKHLKSYTENGG